MESTCSVEPGTAADVAIIVSGTIFICIVKAILVINLPTSEKVSFNNIYPPQILSSELDRQKFY
jgi:hypothetical protein